MPAVVAILAACTALAAPQDQAAPPQDAWKRQWVTDTRLSVELPGSLVAGSETEAKDGGWVRTAADFRFEDDRVFVQVTVFRGDPATKPSHRLLRDVWSQIREGMAGPDAAKDHEPEADWVDDAPALTDRLVLPQGQSRFFLRATLVADSGLVFAVLTVAIDETGPSSLAAGRIHGSVRYVPAER